MSYYNTTTTTPYHSRYSRPSKTIWFILVLNCISKIDWESPVCVSLAFFVAFLSAFDSLTSSGQPVCYLYPTRSAFLSLSPSTNHYWTQFHTIWVPLPPLYLISPFLGAFCRDWGWVEADKSEVLSSLCVYRCVCPLMSTSSLQRTRRFSLHLVLP